MARITSEDCLDHVENIFELVLIGSRRARLLMSGAEQPYLTSSDKNTVLALREISLGKVDASILDSDDISPMFPGASRFAKAPQEEIESPEQTEELRQMQEALLSDQDSSEAATDTDTGDTSDAVKEDTANTES